eukprot:CAMPEP_0183293574 /NCGR_PEP_ID=MMETSP0160_2-20130417/2207_1 /TAXON_ID=2839 ORGANISM="Odontella Sinensis, Strain Grunow 1884" /NCGR_SAMPLE_ID=MMETSP0160_2 /ASSEMBLY_ACC=CAM_ASM_000250 /LENGTH=109 /DNA_ID=CAMNT_0025454713 /DNA_START=48 /DNA_END=377 /DNA_ORIENTATION=+
MVPPLLLILLALAVLGNSAAESYVRGVRRAAASEAIRTLHGNIRRRKIPGRSEMNDCLERCDQPDICYKCVDGSDVKDVCTEVVDNKYEQWHEDDVECELEKDREAFGS